MTSPFVGLKIRIFSALGAVFILFLVSHFAGVNGVSLLGLLVILLGCYEYMHITFKVKNPFYIWSKVLFFICCTIFLLSHTFLHSLLSSLVMGVTLVLYLSLLIWVMPSQVGINEIRQFASDSIMGFVYTAILPSFALKILFLTQGVEWFCFLLIVVFSGDTAAYFSGLYLGKRKLMESVSPKKTVAGAWGGLLGSGLSAWVLSFYIFPHYSAVLLIVGAVLTGFFAQMGDLFESLLKRVSHSKDSGKIMPGHGGVLDRLDGIYFASPVVFALANGFQFYF